MSDQYNRLIKLLIDRKMTNLQLAKRPGFSANITTRLIKDEYNSMEASKRYAGIFRSSF